MACSSTALDVIDVRLLGQVDLADAAAARRVAAAEDAGAARVGEDQDGLRLVADRKPLAGHSRRSPRPVSLRRTDDPVAQQGRHDARAVGPVLRRILLPSIVESRSGRLIDHGFPCSSPTKARSATRFRYCRTPRFSRWVDLVSLCSAGRGRKARQAIAVDRAGGSGGRVRRPEQGRAISITRDVIGDGARRRPWDQHSGGPINLAHLDPSQRPGQGLCQSRRSIRFRAAGPDQLGCIPHLAG